MSSRVEVISYIRFQLGQLSAKNAQHEFEHICRHYARAVICPYILPATGPVQAGGDQGRDFESFISLMSSDGRFAGMVEDKVIAFCCTLQKTAHNAKIKDDVRKILANGTPVTAIHYFLESDIDVRKRHELEEWARQAGVSLTIHDGQALAEGIAAPSEFWIAVELLHVPSSLWPTPEDLEYSSRKQLWIKSDNKGSPVYFQEGRDLARFALSRPDFAGELSFWFTALKDIMNRHTRIDIRRRSAYEIVMLAMLSGQPLEMAEDAIRFTASELQNLDDHGSIMDAFTVLGAVAAWSSQGGRANEWATDLESWRNVLANRIELIKSGEPLTGELVLREILTYLKTKPEDPEALLDGLTEILIDAQARPLFPLRHFAIRISKLARIFVENPKYQKLTDLLDETVATRVGSAAAADQRDSRAEILYKNDELLPAVRQLQRAKPSWYIAGGLENVCLCMLRLAKWYLELGLPLAAKYNALTVLGILVEPGVRSAEFLKAEALHCIVSTDFVQGAWLKVADLAVAAIGSTLEAHPQTEEGLDVSAPILAMLGIVMNGAKLWNGEMAEEMRNSLIAQGCPVSQFDIHKQWRIDSWTMLIQQAQLEDLMDAPFSDAGARRRLKWTALGIAWILDYENTETLDRQAEEIGAALQIAMTIVGDPRDLEMLPEIVLLTLIPDIGDGEPDLIETGLDGEMHCYDLLWPTDPPKTSDVLFRRLVNSVVMLLARASIVPEQSLLPVVEKFLSQDGIHALIFARLMSDVDAKLIPRTAWNCRKPGANPLFKSNDRRIHETLKWPEGLSPRYSESEVQGHLVARYAHVLNSTRLTLPKLLGLPDFNAAIKSFREEGLYLDWQVLNAVAVRAANLRYQQAHGDFGASDDPEEAITIMMHWIKDVETEAWPSVSLDEFSEQRLREVLTANMVASLNLFGMQPRWEYPNFNAIIKYLDVRFRYFDDDIEHEDPFRLPISLSSTATPPGEVKAVVSQDDEAGARDGQQARDGEQANDIEQSKVEAHGDGQHVVDGEREDGRDDSADDVARASLAEAPEEAVEVGDVGLAGQEAMDDGGDAGQQARQEQRGEGGRGDAESEHASEVAGAGAAEVGDADHGEGEQGI